MARAGDDDLWRNFPKTAQEFEARFATEEDCRAYWIEARWGGQPACSECESTRVWSERKGRLFECIDCGHQTSLTSGTLLQGTRKPFKTWFRAVFEISSRRNGISAKELQRILGFGSYEPPGRGCTSCARRWCGRIASRCRAKCRSTRRSWVASVGESRWCSSPPKPTEECGSPTPKTTMKRR